MTNNKGAIQFSEVAINIAHNPVHKIEHIEIDIIFREKFCAGLLYMIG